MTVSRRDFLKLSSLATGGGALGGLSALGASLAPARARAEELRIKEWRLAETSGAFRTWLEAGAPSADREARSA